MALVAGLEGEYVDGVVLWDPILECSNYIPASNEHHGSADTVGPTPPEKDGLPPGTIGMGGFPLTPRLKGEIAQVDLTRLKVPHGKTIEVIVSSESANTRELVSTWNAEGASARYRCVPSEGDWSKDDRFGSALIPQAIIKGVVDALAATAAVS